MVKPVNEGHENRPDDGKERCPRARVSILAPLAEPLDFSQLGIDRDATGQWLDGNRRRLALNVAATDRAGKNGNRGMHRYPLRSRRLEESFNVIEHLTCAGAI